MKALINKQSCYISEFKKYESYRQIKMPDVSPPGFETIYMQYSINTINTDLTQLIPPQHLFPHRFLRQLHVTVQFHRILYMGRPLRKHQPEIVR